MCTNMLHSNWNKRKHIRSLSIFLSKRVCTCDVQESPSYLALRPLESNAEAIPADFQRDAPPRHQTFRPALGLIENNTTKSHEGPLSLSGCICLFWCGSVCASVCPSACASVCVCVCLSLSGCVDLSVLVCFFPRRSASV